LHQAPHTERRVATIYVYTIRHHQLNCSQPPLLLDRVDVSDDSGALWRRVAWRDTSTTYSDTALPPQLRAGLAGPRPAAGPGRIKDMRAARMNQRAGAMTTTWSR